MKTVKPATYVLLSLLLVGCSTAGASIDDLSKMLGSTFATTDELLRPVATQLGKTNDDAAKSISRWLSSADEASPGTIGQAQSSTRSNHEFGSFLNDLRCFFADSAAALVSTPDSGFEFNRSQEILHRLELSSPADLFPEDSHSVSQIKTLYEQGLPIADDVLDFVSNICY